MGLIIKKKVWSKKSCAILHLKYVYSVGTKAKKKQQVYVKGGTGYIYKQTSGEKAAYDSQQAINTTRQGSLTPHFYGGPQTTEFTDGQPNFLLL